MCKEDKKLCNIYLETMKFFFYGFLCWVDHKRDEFYTPCKHFSFVWKNLHFWSIPLGIMDKCDVIAMFWFVIQFLFLEEKGSYNNDIKILVFGLLMFLRINETSNHGFRSFWFFWYFWKKTSLKKGYRCLKLFEFKVRKGRTVEKKIMKITFGSTLQK